MTPPLTRGEVVIIRAGGRELAGMVAVASPNGRSVILKFEGVLGGWVGALPAFEELDETWTALNGMPLELSRRPTS